jgi:hypothetical protein
MIINYEELIRQFLDKGYNVIFFNELSNEYNELIIRHDIDYDCELAFKMAEVEHSHGVKSTYFFMLSNPFYNIFSEKNKKYINKIKAFGHNISVHYDFKVGDLKKEIDIFESFFDTKINIISIHRPDLTSLNGIDIEHTYLPKYFKDIKYFSDSGGKFKYGHPMNSEEFKYGKSIQLLIHPVWSISVKSNPIDIMNDIIENNHNMNKDWFKKNSKIYKEYLK